MFIIAQEYISRAALRRRGWTDSAISLFLGIHDKEVPNPHYKSSAPMKLFKLGRVEHIEASIEYQRYKYKSKPRLEASQKAIKTKMGNLLAKVAQIEIYLHRKNFEDIQQDAINSYNEFKSNMASEREDFDYRHASNTSDREFLNRITVNYLRHRCSPYERMLDKIAGKVGKHEAYALLNQRIFHKIGDMYPELKGECDKQLAEKIQKICEAEP